MYSQDTDYYTESYIKNEIELKKEKLFINFKKKDIEFYLNYVNKTKLEIDFLAYKEMLRCYEKYSDERRIEILNEKIKREALSKKVTLKNKKKSYIFNE